MKKLKVLSLLFLFSISWSSQASQENYNDMSIDELKQKASELHPSGIYILAGKLFKADKKDDAVFWFYVGQIRFRVHLAANPKLEPSGDPALFSSLNYTLGQPINEYAGGDPDTWVKQTKKAKQWDSDNPNKTTPKEKNKTVYNQILSGLDQMINNIEQNKEMLRKQRDARGLENR